MRICMPTAGTDGLTEQLHGHFGSAPYFTFCDTDTDEVRAVANGNTHHAHGQCQPLRALAGDRFDAILTGGMGRRAVQMMNDAGIKVFQLQGATVGEALAAFRGGQLTELTPAVACGGHGHGHTCGH